MQKTIFISSLLILFANVLQAQKPGDYDYIYTDLTLATENPSWVFHLDLSRQRLDEIPNSIYTFKWLRTLDLSKNKISQLAPDIAALSSLEELDLSHNNLSLLPYQFSSLSKLEILDLSKNSIKQLPANFGKLQSLVNLNLWANELESLPESFSQLKHNLIELNLKSMVFDDESITKLKNEFPNTKIYFPNRCDCRP